MNAKAQEISYTKEVTASSANDDRKYDQMIVKGRNKNDPNTYYTPHEYKDAKADDNETQTDTISIGHVLPLIQDNLCISYLKIFVNDKADFDIVVAEYGAR